MAEVTERGARIPLQLKGKSIQSVLKERPLSSFYKGLAPVLQTCGISNFIYFYIWVLAKALRQKMRAGGNRHKR